MRGTVETPSCLLYVSPATQLWTLSPVKPRGAFEGDQAPGILPVSLGVVGSQGAWPVTSGSSSRLVSGSWGGSQGAAHLSPGCPSLPHERTRPPGSPHHPRSPPCHLWPDTGPPRTGQSEGREVGGEQGNARAITRARRRFVMVTRVLSLPSVAGGRRAGCYPPHTSILQTSKPRLRKMEKYRPSQLRGFWLLVLLHLTLLLPGAQGGGPTLDS